MLSFNYKKQLWQVGTLAHVISQKNYRVLDVVHCNTVLKFSDSKFVTLYTCHFILNGLQFCSQLHILVTLISQNGELK